MNVKALLFHGTQFFASGPSRQAGAHYVYDQDLLWLTPTDRSAAARLIESEDFSSLRRDSLVLSIPAALCFSYILELPTLSHDEIQQMLPFELSRLLPLDVESVTFDWVLLNQDESNTRLWVFAVPQGAVADILANTALPARSIAQIDVSISSLYQAALQEHSSELMLWLGLFNSCVDMILVQDGTLLAQRSITRFHEEEAFILDELQRFMIHAEELGHDRPSHIHALTFHDMDEKAATVIAAIEEWDIPVSAQYFPQRSSYPKDLRHLDLRPRAYRRQKEIRERIRAFAILGVLTACLLLLLVGINDLLFSREIGYVDFLHESSLSLGPQTDTLEEMMERILESQKAGRERSRFFEILDQITAQTPPGVLIDYLSLNAAAHLLRLGGQADTRAALFVFLERLSGLSDILELRPLSMPLVAMDNTEVVDYQVELVLKALI
ncbi:MAG: hypothetical protein GX117_08765 [Candidatus Hydrogenedentes bacterium]|nr:hypothetical protein [Candidatus Hydrogenedentota bacterium]